MTKHTSLSKIFALPLEPHVGCDYAVLMQTDETTDDATISVGYSDDVVEQVLAVARAVNCYDDLFSVAQRLAIWNGKGNPSDLINQAREAIAKAENAS